MSVLRTLPTPWLLLAWLLLGPLAHAQTPLRKDLRRDFGAVGDGRTNDQAALQRAATFFNQRARTPAGIRPAVLIIPAGIYLVGQPEATGPMPDLLQLVGCRNLTVQGADSSRTEIRYAAGLRYGAFDPATRRPFEAPAAFFTDPAYAARVSTSIVLQDCENVTVAGLAINGNSTQAVVGGHWGDTGIQLGYDGIFITNSRRITLRGLALHHLGRDGIQVLNHLAKSLADPRRDSIVLEGVSCRYNGRQGLSITGASGLRATNCDFSHTGRVIIPALGKALASNPAAGVDLEPEGGFVMHVRFENCRFVDNAGQGIVSDRPGDAHTTQDIVVTNCLLWGLTNWSAWVSQPGFLFTDCRIYGAFVHGCRAANATEATRFVRCTFEDRPYHGQTAYGIFMLHSDGAARYMSFTDCRFVGTRTYLMWAIVSKPPGGEVPDSASFFHLRRCTFLYDYAQPTQGAGNNLQGAVFTGANVFRDGPHRSSKHRTTTTLGNGAPATPTIIRAPGSLQLLATNCSYDLINGLDVGRAPAHTRDSASLVIGNANSLTLHQTYSPRPELYIGPTARLVVKKGGALVVETNTRLTLAGQLVVEDGAYFYLDPGATVTTVGRGRMRLTGKAIRGRRPD
jgi:hypothetical protein